MRTLKERLEIARQGPPVRTKKSIAEAVGISTASVSDWFSGKTKTIEGVNLINVARFLGISPVWLATGRGPMRDDDISYTESGYLYRAAPDQREMQYVRQIGSLQQQQAVQIPMLAAIPSMGKGESLTYEGDQIIDHLPVSKQWLERSIKANPINLRVITGAGDSMHPTFNDGDMLLVDVSKRQIDVDGVYVLSAHDRLFIKRVRQKMDGTFEVSSDNPTVKTVDVLNGNHQISVHGRVVWAWNGRHL